MNGKKKGKKLLSTSNMLDRFRQWGNINEQVKWNPWPHGVDILMKQTYNKYIKYLNILSTMKR